MRTVAIVQARAGGTRLPGKVLMDLCGAPMLVRQMERLKLCRMLDDIVLAVPDTPENNGLAMWCVADHGWPIHRGPEEDVLTRYLQAAEAAEADIVVRVTADCPCIDPTVIDETVMMFMQGADGYRFDFVANNLLPTFPHGMDVEVMSRATLAIAASKATDAYDREHVTPWITRNGAGGSVFRLGNLACERQGYAKYRVTVDYPEDLTLVRAIWLHFLEWSYWGVDEIVDFLSQRPDLVALNARHRSARMTETIGNA